MNIHSEMVSVPRAGGKGTMESYLARPEGAGPFPGLVVIHEIYGLNENIRDIAGRFAEQGYAALAVDLFSNRARAMCMLQLFYGMTISTLDNPMLADLKSCLEFMRIQPGVDAGRLGAVGFCMGGTYALQLAVTEKGMKAASVFYGVNPKPLESVAQACPVIGSYPENDFSAKMGRELDAALTRYNVPHDVKVYPNARHSFFNDRGERYAPEAARDAWTRMLSFFDQHLVH